MAGEVLDELALAALQARQEGVERSQVNKLIEYLESTDSFTLILFLVRQVARGQWSRAGRHAYSAARLVKVIRRLIEKVSSENERKEVLRKVLGYFKWFYESYDLNRRVVDELRKVYGQALNQVFKDPKQTPPRGFAEAYLRALLRI